MSIQSNFPAIKPTLLLDFSNTEQLDPRITFTRASTATYFDQLGVMQTAASGVARFDHNPTTFESLGLLIEEQRTNLLVRSQELDNASWVKTRSSVTANNIVAPDGTLTGDKFVEDTTASNNHYAYVLSTISATTTYTWTVYAKAGERTWLGMSAYDGSTRLTFFNLSSGTVGTNASGNTASITAVGNGWYRCTITRTSGAGTTAALELYLASADNTISYTGDGASGIYIWGAQLEAGAFPTSYIQTVASQVTRAADAASMTGTNFSSWYNAAEGTMYAEAASSGYVLNTSFPLLMSFDDGTGNNRITLFQGGSSNSLNLNVRKNSVSSTLGDSNVDLSNSMAKVAGGYSVATVSVSANAGAIATGTSGGVPEVSRCVIGGTSVYLSQLNGTIRKIAYYPLRVTNAQLQGLTS